MSDADELRSAASILWELAEGATPGPWGWEPAIPSNRGAQHDAGLTSPSCRLTSGDDIWIRDAVYIATVNPLVGVALADLLDSLADDLLAGSIRTALASVGIRTCETPFEEGTTP